jgi:hypothetical protein
MNRASMARKFLGSTLVQGGHVSPTETSTQSLSTPTSGIWLKLILIGAASRLSWMPPK